MGLAFTEIAPNQKATLLDWVSALGGEPLLESKDQAEPEIKSGAETELANQLSLKEVVQELVALLVRKQLLTDSEAARFRGRLCE